MVQISKVLLFSLLAGIPAFAAPLNTPTKVAGRSPIEKILREVSNIAEVPSHPHRNADSHIDSTTTHTLQAREPLFGFIKKIASSIFGRELSNDDVEGFMARANRNDIITRSTGFETLEVRAPLFGFIKKIASSIFGRDLTEVEVSEVLARVDADDLASRDFEAEDLEAREPLFGFIKKIASSIFGRHLSNAEVDDLLL